MKNAVIHHYYKKSIDGLTILVKLNPVDLTGKELILDTEGNLVKTDRQYDADIYQDLAEDEFESASALEFNLHLTGLGRTDSKV